MYMAIGELKVTLLSDREIALSRTFNAPRRLVFDVFTNPSLVQRWLEGPPGFSFAMCNIDLTEGGGYHYVWRRETDQSESTVRGIFRAIIQDYLVSSETADDGSNCGRTLDTMVLINYGAKTMLRVVTLYESREARDFVLTSGALNEMAAGYDKLESFLTSLVPQNPPSDGPDEDGASTAVHLWTNRFHVRQAS